MRAGFLEDIRTARFITDAAEPQITQPDQVKIHVRFVGICGSEVSAYRGKHRFRKPPVISGHEYAGDIIEVGGGVRDWKVGDRVTSDANQGCGHCFLCKRGDYNICRGTVNLGARSWSGPFGEYIVVPEASLVRLPEDVSYQEGALIEPLSIGMHAVKRAKIAPDENVLIIGAGPIGTAVCLSAKAMGIKTITIADLMDFNLSLVNEIAHPIIVNSSRNDLDEEILRITNGQGADVAFVCFGDTKVVDQCMRCVRPGGRIVQVAVVPSDLPFKYDLLLQKELSYMASERSVKQDYIDVVSAIEKGIFDPTPMITEIHPIEEFQEVMDFADQRPRPFMKLMFHF